MKRFLLAICVAMAMMLVVGPAFATELWDPHLRGADGGLVAAALPPPGFYFINDFYFAPNYAGYGPNFGTTDGTRNNNVKLFAYVDVPILLWTPGCQFLGADYGVAIAQPFDYTNLRVNTGLNAQGNNTWVGGDQWGTFNTLLIPYILSWKLPYDFRVKTSFSIGFNDATTRPGSVQSGGPYAQSGNGTYMFTPVVGLSWLHEGWNVSGEFFFTFQTENDGTHYQSGDQFAADYTITYTYQKWTFGLVAAQENQVENDKISGISRNDSKAEAYTMGPTLGYNFGPCSLSFTYNWTLYANNEVGGDWFNLRLVVPLGNPYK
jgi:hypothetical protein